MSIIEIKDGKQQLKDIVLDKLSEYYEIIIVVIFREVLFMNEKKQKREISLKRTLTLPLIIMFGLSYLAPTVVFNYYGLFTPGTHGMYTLALCTTAVVMAFTAYSYTQMVKAYPSAGSAYTYISKSVQPHLGFLSGWVMLVDYLLLPMICYLLLGVYINEYFPMIPVWAIVVVVAAIGMIINIVGIKTASIIDTIVTCAAIAFTILFVACIVRYVTGGGGAGTLFDPSAFYNPDNFELKGVLSASAVLCASFVGFDAVTTLAEEAKEPEKVMGKAIMGVVIGAGIIFAIVAYFSQIAWPSAHVDIQDPDTGIFELFPHIGMSWLGTVFFIVDNCGSFVCALAGMGAVSRILYGMGRDNILPKKFFGRISPKFRTPVNNIILTTLIALTALFYQDNVMGAASLVSFGAVCGFFMVNFSVISHYIIKGREKGFSAMIRHLAVPALGMMSLLAVFYFIETPAKILGGIWLLTGVIYLLIKTKGFRQLPPEMKIDE